MWFARFKLRVFLIYKKNLPSPKINTSNPLKACKSKHVGKEYLRYTAKKIGEAIAVKINAVKLRNIMCP